MWCSPSALTSHADMYIASLASQPFCFTACSLLAYLRMRTCHYVCVCVCVCVCVRACVYVLEINHKTQEYLCLSSLCRCLCLSVLRFREGELFFISYEK